MLRNLKELELSVPEEVIRSRITSYHLHSPFGIIDIANREQQRIGSDLHDGLGQELTGIALSPEVANSLALGTLILAGVLSIVLNVRDLRRERNVM